MADTKNPMEMVLITGMSGSGKSVALHALEDAGFYCVDNLPPELLMPFVELETKHNANRLAIAMDVRSATSLPQVPRQLDALRAQGVTVKPLFLDATTDTLVRRYSETRRRHPLTSTEEGLATDQQHAHFRPLLQDAGQGVKQKVKPFVGVKRANETDNGGATEAQLGFKGGVGLATGFKGVDVYRVGDDGDAAGG